METLNIDKPPELVTNIEVMEILAERVKERDNGNKKHGKSLKLRDWIEEKVLEYLESTPCALGDMEKMPHLTKQLTSKFQLTKAETLQALNFMPSESVEIHLFLPELQSRMKEERQQEMLQLIQSCKKVEDPPEEKVATSMEDEEIVGDVDDEVVTKLALNWSGVDK